MMPEGTSSRMQIKINAEEYVKNETLFTVLVEWQISTPLWKSVWGFLRLGIELPHSQGVPLFSVRCKELFIIIQQYLCAPNL